MEEKKIIKRLLFTAILSTTVSMAWSQSPIMPDAMPGLAKNDQKSDTLTEMYLPSSMTDEDFHGFAELNIDNLLSVLGKYNVKEKKIVLAQALLETGYFC